MKTQSLLPIAAALFIACAGSAVISTQSQDSHVLAAAAPAALAATAIVDLPAVTVRPEAADLAYYQANRIVDLATITVRPQAEDLAPQVAAAPARVIDLPTLTVYADADDARHAIRDVLVAAGQLASR